ncbi:hypothetical protein L218DRAFT_273599 [Marasmius fiardii PR-910]|nr:hypothetical protein L218DRAFT_273599 [Marasmius fiardii PR-910]
MTQNRNRAHRRPRTSPLAGPFFVADRSIVVHDTSPVRAKLSRISSVSGLRSLNPPPYRSVSASSSTPLELPPAPPLAFRFPPPRPPRSALRGSLVLGQKTAPVAFIPTATPNSAFCSTRHYASGSVPSLHIALPVSAKNHKRYKSLTTAHYSSFARLPSFPSTGRDVRFETTRGISATWSEGGEKGIVIDALPHDTRSDPSPKNSSLDQSGISGARSSIKLQMPGENPPLTAFRDSQFKELLPNRQSLFSIPGSPNYMDLEFNLITDGEDAGDIVVSPRTENSFPTGKKIIRSIIIPSVPVDVDLETPLSPTSFSEQSIRQFTIKSRTHSAVLGAPRRRPSLKQRKSLASLKAHKRAVSKADSVLFATNPIKKIEHIRDASFLSFASDGSDDDHQLLLEIDGVSEGSEPEFERTLSHKRSIDTFSIDSEDLREAEELITDILALPTPIDSSTRLSTPTMQSPNQWEGRYSTMPLPSVPRIAKTRSYHPGPIVSPPPITELPSPPSSPAISTPIVSQQPSKTLELPNIVLPAVLTPISPRGRTAKDGILYHSPAAGPSNPRASCSTDDHSDTESCSSRTVTVTQPTCSKALDILGIDTDAISFKSGTATFRSVIARETDETVVSASVKLANMGRGSLSKASGLLGIQDEPPLRKKRSPTAKALEVLGVYGDQANPNMVNMATPPYLTAHSPHTVKGKRGGVKKLWKTLTGASVKESAGVHWTY